MFPKPYHCLSEHSPRAAFPQTQNCLAVLTQAALLAGFAYSGLTQVAIPLDAEYVLKLLYLLVTTTAMCLELIAVMNCTLLSMMGPGLALRGPDGSMHPAVDGMMEEYQSAYLCFVLGLIAFHFSAALFGWLMFNWVVSSFVSASVIGSLYLLVRYASRVYARFRLPPEEVITGRFSGEEVRHSPEGERPLAALRHASQLGAARTCPCSESGSPLAASILHASPPPPPSLSLGWQVASAGGAAGAPSSAGEVRDLSRMISREQMMLYGGGD